MSLLFVAVIFVVVVVGVSLLGLKLWVQPQEAIERVAGVGMEATEQAPTHPSLAFHDLLKRLGDRIPTSAKDANVIQKRLIRAGYRDPSALKILYGAKVGLAVLLPLLMTLAVANSESPSEKKVMAVVASAVV